LHADINKKNNKKRIAGKINILTIFRKIYQFAKEFIDPGLYLCPLSNVFISDSKKIMKFFVFSEAKKW
jgi:hypothetical protein